MTERRTAEAAAVRHVFAAAVSGLSVYRQVSLRVTDPEAGVV